MSRQGRVRRITPATDQEDRLRPLYARVLRLRHLNPGGMLCFVFLEGAVALGLLLALAELVSWWGMLVLPVAVAVMVKANDLLAGAVARAAALVPEQERERFRREVVPAVGRAIVPARPVRDAGGVGAEVPGPRASVVVPERGPAGADSQMAMVVAHPGIVESARQTAKQQLARRSPPQWPDRPDPTQLRARQSGHRRYD
jgi:hypothetical protein